MHQLAIPQYISGRGSLSFVSGLEKKKIGIIRGKKSYSEYIKSTILTIAGEMEADVCELTQITDEPYIEDIFNCMEKVKTFKPDMILAIGGGSVLDVAKGVHLFYENPNLTYDEALVPFSLPKLGKKAIHVSVPTTCGTGSEATSVAVFTDRNTNLKTLLMDNHLIPHYAILDANVIDHLPDNLLSITAMDALTHAIEASTASNRSVMTEMFALQAALELLENIVPATDAALSVDLRKKSRERVHIAASIAGVSITNSCTGIVHSYDHPGPYFNLPHGVVCSLMLPHTMELIGSHPSYAALATRLGYNGSEEQKSIALVQHIRSIQKSLSLPSHFNEAGIDREEFFSCIPFWAEQSLNAFATKTSPANMTYEKGIALYRSCYSSG